MLRRIFLLAAPATLAAGAAWAQANLVPDPTPRLPPQPGQGLPVEDRRFLRDAATLSAAQAEVGALAAERAAEEETRRFAAGLAERHRRMAQEIATLSRARGLTDARPDEGVPGERVAEAVQRLNSLRQGAAAPGGGLDREFLAAQLQVHPVLVEMYQTEASNSTDREIGSFAITSMVGLQEDFTAAARLGGQYGLAPPDRLLANPPQYGPGAGPAR